MQEVVLHAGGLLHGSAGPALEAHLRRQPGIYHVAVNPVSGTLTVGYDETAILEVELHRLIRECGYHCRGQVLPKHICAPEPGPATPTPPAAPVHAAHAPPARGGASSGEMAQMAHEMGHGGGMTMDEMVRDMRKRFLVTFGSGSHPDTLPRSGICRR